MGTRPRWGRGGLKIKVRTQRGRWLVRSRKQGEKLKGFNNKTTLLFQQWCVTHRYVVSGLRLAGTDDSPISEQSTMIKIPSSSQWHGDGHVVAAVACLSWIRPYPHAPGADPQTPPATQSNRSTRGMSGWPPVCICTCGAARLVSLSDAALINEEFLLF